MKLSEVIKAIEDGSRSKYLSNNYKIEFVEGIGIKTSWKESPILFPNLDGWEKIKPSIKFSDNEKKLFELFSWAKYMSIEQNKDIILSEEMPELYEETHSTYWVTEGKVVTISSSVEVTDKTFEESPIYIGDLKGE